ncbi:hypothetical protein GUITHDRAFT_104131 [Guillardia theta CCMP2712]|uniref:Uncharacterized protein n=1 Tax=Guillardia theta (strain CCMP2712) TaxID=905079 RepID=L1JPG2_GUITC|nr:hypothetical protein GUITHDRAFT_104131 [Guillardia theta CCMP2712]EKX50322.1 hypothetical protein GUITHDRAFT_104131 [Guillardia theta CCMP2712]|eukprot:XP_005837302.1 hypothetical protein GUITHDRAFT_104131 [Guillardia theta CCMP2712]
MLCLSCGLNGTVPVGFSSNDSFSTTAQTIDSVVKASYASYLTKGYDSSTKCLLYFKSYMCTQFLSPCVAGTSTVSSACQEACIGYWQCFNRADFAQRNSSATPTPSPISTFPISVSGAVTMPVPPSSFDETKKSKFRTAIAKACSLSVDRVTITAITSSRRQTASSTVEFAVQTADLIGGSTILASLTASSVSSALVEQGLEAGTLLVSSLSLSTPTGTEKIRYLEFECEATMTCSQYQKRSYLYRKSVATLSQVDVSMVTVVQAQDASPDLCNLKTKIQTTESLVTSTKQTISIISLNGELLRNGIPNCKTVTQVTEVTSDICLDRLKDVGYIRSIYERKDITSIASLNFNIFSGEFSLLKSLPPSQKSISAMKEHLERYSNHQLCLDLKQFQEIFEFCRNVVSSKTYEATTQKYAYKLLAVTLDARISKQGRTSEEFQNTVKTTCQFVVGQLLDNQLSKNATLLAERIEVCNRLCFKHPEALDNCVMAGNKTAYEYYRKALSSHIKNEKTICGPGGCISGMRGLMSHFRFKEIEASSQELMKDCTTTLWKWLDTTTKIRKYDVVKASLRLLEEHPKIVAKYLIECVRIPTICNTLLKWCRHVDREVRSAALSAFDAWSSHLRKYPLSRQEVEDLYVTYKDLMEESDLRCVSLSFRGRGSISSHVASYQMNVLDDFIPSCWRYWNLVLSKPDDEEQNNLMVEILPNFLISVADVILNIPKAVEDQDCSFFIGEAVRFLFQSYPSIMKIKQYLHERAWFFLYFSVKTCSTPDLNCSFLVPTALSASIESTQPGNRLLSVEQAEEQNENSSTSLINLWTCILDNTHVEWIENNVQSRQGDKNKCNIGLQEVQFDILNRLLSQTVIILNSLDLSLTIERRPGDGPDSPQSRFLSPGNHNDLRIYSKLCNLCAGVLEKLVRCSNMENLNLRAFMRSILMIAVRNPTLTGLLKILTPSIQISSRSKELKDYLQSLNELQQLARNVSDLSMQHENEEDLCCSLEFVMAIPMDLIEFSIHDRVVRLSLSVGFARETLLDRTLKFIEEWIESEQLEHISQLVEVCRLVELYLQKDRNIQQESKMNSRSRQDTRRRSRVEKNAEVHVEFARRAICILGKTSHLMWHTSVDADLRGNVNNHSALLRLTLEKGALGVFYLDKITARILEIASDFPDQKTRLIFAEILHTITCLVIGKIKSNGKKSEDKAELSVLHTFGQLYGTILTFSADIVKEIRMICSTLNEQIINWLTSDCQTLACFSVEAFDAIIEDSRSSVASTKWAVMMLEKLLEKARSQRSKRQKPEDAVITLLMNRLYGILSHPDASQRLAGSLITVDLANFLMNGNCDFGFFVKQHTIKLCTCCMIGLNFTATDYSMPKVELNIMRALAQTEKLLIQSYRVHQNEDVEEFEKFVERFMKRHCWSSYLALKISYHQITRQLELGI